MKFPTGNVFHLSSSKDAHLKGCVGPIREASMSDTSDERGDLCASLLGSGIGKGHKREPTAFMAG